MASSNGEMMVSTLSNDNINPNEKSHTFSRSEEDAEAARSERRKTSESQQEPLSDSDKKNQTDERAEEVRKGKDPATAKKRSPLVSLTHIELLEKDILPRKLILAPWLPEAGICMIYAPAGVGKTQLCLSVAITIASGGSMFTTTPWKALEPNPVLYCDGEMHEADLQDRVRKFHKGKQISDGFLRYVNGTWQPEGMPDLSKPEGQRLVDELIRSQGTKVLILDNLSTLCLSGRENETDSWKPVQAWFLRLRHSGVSVIIVHHASKSRDDSGKPRQRGTSLHDVTLDSSIVLDRPRNCDEEDGCVFHLSYVKNRGFYGTDATPLEVRLIEEKSGAFSWIDRKLVQKTYDEVVDLYNDGMQNPKDLATELGVGLRITQKHLKKAKAAGDIHV